MKNAAYCSFLEHLVELRRRLIIIAIAVTLGMGVAWNFSTEILCFIEKPLTGKTYLSEIKKRLYSQVKVISPALFSHYKLDQVVNTQEKSHSLNYSAPMEPFFVQCKISMLAGLILALPVVFLQLWQFMSPGLTQRERQLAFPFVVSATLTFCCGATFFLTIVWPVIINFSLSYEVVGLQSWFNVSAYIDFCLRLILIFGLIFELPVLTLLLSRFGVVGYPFLASKRKYALLASSVIAAFHADLITMFVIMVPLYVMYELSVWVAFFFGTREGAVPAGLDVQDLELET
ncbi:MAG: twin-arginine translocase subunit TatC [Desulfuromonadales bacterium]|nr:twin-arginine translocase subunit TatC [Desulfuromonadales bacterium]